MAHVQVCDRRRVSAIRESQKTRSGIPGFHKKIIAALKKTQMLFFQNSIFLTVKSVSPVRSNITE
jgi:hypothetical protein